MKLYKYLFLSFLFVGCSANKTPAEPVLRVAIWANYLPDELVEKFQSENGVKLVTSNFSSNEELLAKMQAGGTQYDLIIPSDYMVGIMVQQGLLRPLDAKKLPNSKHLDADLINRPFDPGNQYTFPYGWGTVGIAVNRNFYKGRVESWNDFFNSSDLSGKISMLDDMREVLGAALKSRGFSVNSKTDQEIEDAKSVLIKSRPRIRMFTSEPMPALSSGEIAVAQMYSIEAYQLKRKMGDLIEFVTPKEGGTVAIDNFAIPKTAENWEAAHKFINFMLVPEHNRVLVNSIMVGAVLKANRNILKDYQGSTREGLKKNQVSLESIVDVGETTKRYDRAWTEVKSSL